MYDSLEKLLYFFTPAKFRDKINIVKKEDSLVSSDVQVGEKILIVCNVADEYGIEDISPLSAISKKLEDEIVGQSPLIDFAGNKIISTSLVKEKELHKSYDFFAKSLKIGVILAVGNEINKDKQLKDIVIYKPNMTAYKICFDGKMCDIIEERDIVIITKGIGKIKE